jgi:DNA polymerase-1
MNKKLVLIDGHALLFRAYYAFPASLTTSEGEIIHAVYGFTSILLNVIRELRPTHIVVSFDLGKPTFRHETFKEYKANRDETPQDLIDQEKRLHQVVKVLNMPVFTKKGYEADDVIGTIAQKAKKEGIDTIIVTGDKDALQLVDDDPTDTKNPGSVSVYMPGRGGKASTRYDEAMVEEKFGGLEPEQIVDLKGLAGDPSDNIPGVKGIGPKTATKLLLRFKTVEGVYEAVSDGRINEVLKGAMLSKLIQGKEMALKSKELATIVRDVEIDFKIEDAVLHDFNKTRVLELFDELGFRSLINKLPNDMVEQDIQEALF